MCMLYFPYQHCQTHIVPEVIYHHALMKKPNFNNYIFGQNMPQMLKHASDVKTCFKCLNIYDFSKCTMSIISTLTLRVYLAYNL